jgi:SAM-dependent methyltransferase
MHLVHRQTCRCCGSDKLVEVVSLGPQHLQGSFVKEGKEMPPQRRVPLTLMRCDVTADENACGLLQLAYSVPPEILYASYWYRSGTNRRMTEHLQGIASEVAARLNKRSARVLDIGCNDGTFLNALPDSHKGFGVDPSDVAAECDGDYVLIRNTFPSPEVAELAGTEPFDAVTSIAMFYDLEAPVDFARAVADYLHADGIWIIELSYMPTMLARNAYDTLCHEHLEYYSLAVIEFIAEKAGLKVVDATLNDINGGSIRCILTHQSSFRHRTDAGSDHVAALRQSEFDLALDTDGPYRAFQKRIDVHRDELRTLIGNIHSQGRTVHVYGASTKGNTILQFCGLDKAQIECAADRNPDKHGARTLGTDIPIVSEVVSREMRPDYYLVLPWHFRKEFLEREAATIKAGTAMIFPLPRIEVVSEVAGEVVG